MFIAITCHYRDINVDFIPSSLNIMGRFKHYDKQS